MKPVSLPGSPERVAAAAPDPHWIGASIRDGDLALWLRNALRRAWPGIRFERCDRPDAIARWNVDLWLAETLPPIAPRRPVLWICGPERHPRLTRLAPRLWELPAPIVQSTLVDAVRVVLRKSRIAPP